MAVMIWHNTYTEYREEQPLKVVEAELVCCETCKHQSEQSETLCGKCRWNTKNTENNWESKKRGTAS